MRDLCGPYGSDTAVRYRLDDISGALTRWEGRRRARTAFDDQQDDQSLWLGVQRLTAEIDRRTMSLLGIPFFLYDTVPVHGDPVDIVWPELSFLQLVSWAYMKFIEAAEPNLRCILRLFTGVCMDAREVQAVRDDIVCLRTFAQHHLQFGSEHDKGTIERAVRLVRASSGPPASRPRTL